MGVFRHGRTCGCDFAGGYAAGGRVGREKMLKWVSKIGGCGAVEKGRIA